MTVNDREHIYNIRSKFENFQLLTSLKVFMLRMNQYFTQLVALGLKFNVT